MIIIQEDPEEDLDWRTWIRCCLQSMGSQQLSSWLGVSATYIIQVNYLHLSNYFTLIFLYIEQHSIFKIILSWMEEWMEWRKNITSNLWNNLGSSVRLARVLLGTCSWPIEGEYYYSTNKSRGHCRYSSWPPLPSSSLVPWQTTSVWKGSIPPGLGLKPSDSAIN